MSDTFEDYDHCVQDCWDAGVDADHCDCSPDGGDNKNKITTTEFERTLAVKYLKWQ